MWNGYEIQNAALFSEKTFKKEFKNGGKYLFAYAEPEYGDIFMNHCTFYDDERAIELKKRYDCNFMPSGQQFRLSTLPPADYYFYTRGGAQLSMN